MAKSPSSLYSQCVTSLAKNFNRVVGVGLHNYLTDSMRLDVYWAVYDGPDSSVSMILEHLKPELLCADKFISLLQVGDRRTQLHTMSHEVLSSDLFYQLTNSAIMIINQAYNKHRGKKSFSQKAKQEQRRSFTNGFNFASFLSDAGWFTDAELLLKRLASLPDLTERQELEVRTKLLHVLAANKKFNEAEDVYRKLLKSVSTWYNVSSSSSSSTDAVDNVGTVMNDFRSMIMEQTNTTLEKDLSCSPTSSHRSSIQECRPNLAAVFAEFSSYFFDLSQYREALDWSMKALEQLNNDLSPKVIIDVLRTASKASVARRQFTKAEILIQEAVVLAREVFGDDHLKYADTLVDFGFYLLNVDGVAKSVQAYKSALHIRRNCFGERNLLVALANEELAYATYVHQYSTGDFDDAIAAAKQSLNTMKELLPEDHLLLSSSQRVLALIMEEVAIDHLNKEESYLLLQHAEQLHLSALNLASQAFGLMNVQTAKHYGNLGRLYQTMERYDEAEAMHVRAIEIKEQILGLDDYEVALSIGHLASLYNYDLNDFAKAEELYLRSIEIGLKLFGPGYSGLEYDYRGLIRVYQDTKDWTNFFKYQYILRDWKTLREAKDDEQENGPELLGTLGTSKPVTKIVQMVAKCDDDAKNNSSSVSVVSMASSSDDDDDVSSLRSSPVSSA